MNWKRYFYPRYDNPWDVYHGAYWVLFVLWIWVGLWPADPETFAKRSPLSILVGMLLFIYMYWSFRVLLRQALFEKRVRERANWIRNQLVRRLDLKGQFDA